MYGIRLLPSCCQAEHWKASNLACPSLPIGMVSVAV